MKKLLITASILACTSAMAVPNVVDVKAVAYPYYVHPGMHIATKADFYVNFWNNSDQVQPISIVYMYCVDNGGCKTGEDTQPVSAHSLFSKEYTLSMGGVQYGTGAYQNTASIDFRIDSTGEHFKHGSYQYISSQ